MCACVRARVRACVCVCARVHACVSLPPLALKDHLGPDQREADLSFC